MLRVIPKSLETAFFQLGESPGASSLGLLSDWVNPGEVMGHISPTCGDIIGEYWGYNQWSRNGVSSGVRNLHGLAMMLCSEDIELETNNHFEIVILECKLDSKCCLLSLEMPDTTESQLLFKLVTSRTRHIRDWLMPTQYFFGAKYWVARGNQSLSWDVVQGSGIPNFSMGFIIFPYGSRPKTICS